LATSIAALACGAPREPAVQPLDVEIASATPTPSSAPPPSSAPYASTTVFVSPIDPPPPSTEPSGADSTGVAECDAYLAKVARCLENDPAMRAAIAAGLRAQTDAWKQMAADPANHAALAIGCTKALDGLRSAMPRCP